MLNGIRRPPKAVVKNCLAPFASLRTGGNLSSMHVHRPERMLLPSQRMLSCGLIRLSGEGPFISHLSERVSARTSALVTSRGMFLRRAKTPLYGRNRMVSFPNVRPLAKSLALAWGSLIRNSMFRPLLFIRHPLMAE